MTASKPTKVVGWFFTIAPAGMLLFSAAMKFSKSPEVVKGFEHLGWPDRYAVTLGLVEAACAVLFLVPHTAVLGAVLVTGYLGGAIATHARLGEPIWIPAGLGVLAWLGLFLREPRLRSLLPIRS